jgi:hypothetical protein
MRIKALSGNIETIGVSSLKGKKANLEENEIQRVPCDSSPSAAIDVAGTVTVYGRKSESSPWILVKCLGGGSSNLPYAGRLVPSESKERQVEALDLRNIINLFTSASTTTSFLLVSITPTAFSTSPKPSLEFYSQPKSQKANKSPSTVKMSTDLWSVCPMSSACNYSRFPAMNIVQWTSLFEIPGIPFADSMIL